MRLSAVSVAPRFERAQPTPSCRLALALSAPGRRRRPVVVTDQAAMQELLAHNIALNGLGARARAAEWDWGAAVPPAVPRRPHVVLAADCVYFEPAFPLLLRSLADLLGASGGAGQSGAEERQDGGRDADDSTETVCLFCFKKRRRADLHFVKAARKLFDVREVDDDPDRERYARENIYL